MSSVLHHAVRGLAFADDENYIPKEYEVPGEVESTSNLPRFGHTGDFSVLLDVANDGQWGEQQTDYIIGVSSGSIFVLSVAIFWFFFLTLMRCLGQRNVGFLAGWFQHNVPSFPAIATIVPEYDHEEESNCENKVLDAECLDHELDQETIDRRNQAQMQKEAEKQRRQKARDELESQLNIQRKILEDHQNTPKERRFQCRVLAVRIVFLICGLFLIISMILFYAKGVTGLANSLSDVDDVVNTLQNSVAIARSSISSILVKKDSLLVQIDESTATSQSCLSTTPQGQNIIRNINTVRSTINDLEGEVTDDIIRIDKDLADIQESLNEIESTQKQNGQIGFAVTVAVNSVIFVMVLYMMTRVFFIAGWSRGCGCCSGATQDEKKAKGCGCCGDAGGGEKHVGVNSKNDKGCCQGTCSNTTTNTIILPLFIIFLLISWMVTSFSLIFAIAGADFCTVPDDYILSVMDTYKDDLSSDVYSYARNYISGCTDQFGGPRLFENLDLEFDSLLSDSRSAFAYFDSLTIQRISSVCNLSTLEANRFKDGVSVLNNAATEAYDNFENVRDLVACSTIHPIYATFVHDAICINGVGGLTWIFATLLSSAIFAMLMLTFRAAIRPIKNVPIENFGPVSTPAPSAGNVDKSNIIGRRTTTSVLPDGTNQVTEVIQIRNVDGTVTEKTMIHTAPTAAIPTAPVEPLAQHTATAIATLPDGSQEAYVVSGEAMQHTIDSNTKEDISEKSEPQAVVGGGTVSVILGKTTTRSALPDGRHEIREITTLRNPDGSISKQTKIRTE